MKFILIQGGRSESKPSTGIEEEHPPMISKKKKLTKQELETIFLQLAESMGKLYSHFLNFN